MQGQRMHRINGIACGNVHPRAAEVGKTLHKLVRGGASSGHPDPAATCAAMLPESERRLARMQPPLEGNKDGITAGRLLKALPDPAPRHPAWGNEIAPKLYEFAQKDARDEFQPPEGATLRR